MWIGDEGRHEGCGMHPENTGLSLARARFPDRLIDLPRSPPQAALCPWHSPLSQSGFDRLSTIPVLTFLRISVPNFPRSPGHLLELFCHRIRVVSSPKLRRRRRSSTRVFLVLLPDKRSTATARHSSTAHIRTVDLILCTV